MGRPGLIQKKVAVKTKRGTVMRTMWVKSNPKMVGKLRQAGGKPSKLRQVGGILRKHAGTLAGAALLAGAAYGVHRTLSKGGHVYESTMKEARRRDAADAQRRAGGTGA